jgi:hypothetical protein
MAKHFVVWSRVWLAIVFMMSTILLTHTAHSDEASQIRRGFDIVAEQFGWNFLNLAGKNRELVGLGSYLLNTTGCNDCHTHPNWATGGNPYLAQPEQINTEQYLTGGRVFTTPAGTFKSPNITPDYTQKPAGLTLHEFLKVMRTGHDPEDGELLQVMPWPLYRWKTERDLTAMYEYLRAIPSLPDNPNPGP